MSGTNIRILIVDDDHDIVEMIRETLSLGLADFNVGYETYSDGEYALSKLSTEKYDLAFVDLSMPKINGESVVVAVRNSGGPNKTMPIVIVSGVIDRVSVEEDDSWLNDVQLVAKPFKPETLVRTAKILLAPQLLAEKEQMV